MFLYTFIYLKNLFLKKFLYGRELSTLRTELAELLSSRILVLSSWTFHFLVTSFRAVMTRGARERVTNTLSARAVIS